MLQHSPENGYCSEPLSNKRPDFATRVQHVLQVCRNGEWITVEEGHTGVVISSHEHDKTPGSYDATHLAPFIPDKPHQIVRRDGTKLLDNTPRNINLTEYSFTPRQDGIEGMREAVLPIVDTQSIE